MPLVTVQDPSLAHLGEIWVSIPDHHPIYSIHTVATRRLPTSASWFLKAVCVGGNNKLGYVKIHGTWVNTSLGFLSKEEYTLGNRILKCFHLVSENPLSVSTSVSLQ